LSTITGQTPASSVYSKRISVRPGFVPPQDFSPLQNFSNPFNPSTKINYELTDSAVVTLKIYDLLGREVRTLLNSEKQSSG